MKNLLLTGGGTGGHVYPNMALLPYFKDYFDNIIYVGRREGIEREVAVKNGISYYGITTVPYSRKGFIDNLKIPVLLKRGVKEAREIISKHNIDVVFSKGGYVGLPAVIAASRCRIPSVCHESDYSIGLANKLGLHYCNLMLTSFPETLAGHRKVKFVGTPIRDEIINAKPIAIPGYKPMLLVIGGSQGAKAINDFIYQNIDSLTNKYHVVHIVGKGELPEAIEDYQPISFSNDVGGLMKSADCVLSRCGAGVASELAALGKKAVFVPLNSAVSRGDQLENAAYYSKFSGFTTLAEGRLNINNLFDAIAECEVVKEEYIFNRNVNADIAEAVNNVLTKG